MRILLKYPTRSRPSLFMQCVDAWRKMASGHHELVWLVSADSDDAKMNNEAIRDWCANKGISIYFGGNKCKIDGFNADLKSPEFTGPWDICMNLSDDMLPTVFGWDEVIVADMPPHLDCGLWYPDGRQLRLNTLSIFGRPIFERMGYIYHPAYKSVYCDDYYQLILQRAGKLKYLKKQIYRHAWREQNHDALMCRNEDKVIYDADRNTFKAMKANARLGDLPVSPSQPRGS